MDAVINQIPERWSTIIYRLDLIMMQIDNFGQVLGKWTILGRRN